MAVGLNYYLKHYCHTHVSWYASDSIVMPKELPMVNESVSRQAKCDNRFFLNYCTFGYTMPYWKWQDWERLIDWMALNGVTMPLAITGQESIWYKVWTEMGLSDEEVRAYFTGPCSFALASHVQCRLLAKSVAKGLVGTAGRITKAYFGS